MLQRCGTFSQEQEGEQEGDLAHGTWKQEEEGQEEKGCGILILPSSSRIWEVDLLSSLNLLVISRRWAG